ncbi:MAG: EAL domain-containing protein [Solirubrobacterales bacterium]|nr:EAL domain-containing protein [Solirubrobacterales bacterium]
MQHRTQTALDRPPRGRAFRVLAGGAALLVLTFAAVTVLGASAVRTSAYLGVMVVATALIALRAYKVPDDRAIWGLIAAGVALTAGAEWVYAIWAVGKDVIPLVGPADPLWLAAYPIWYAALVLLGRRYVGDAHASLWVDGLLVGLAAAAYVAALYLPGLAADTGAAWPTLLVQIAYPSGDLALVAFVAGLVVMLGRPGRQTLLLAAGFGVTCVSDMLWITSVGQGSYAPMLDLGWTLGIVLMAWAAWAPAPSGRVLPVGGWWEFSAPACIASLACAILVADHFAHLPLPAIILAAATFAAALGRLGWTLREVRSLALHRREALTDDLTALPNRRALFRELDVLTAGGERSGRSFSLLQLDLDGFKELNDTLGHQAGDELLIAVGRRLAAATPGVVALLGGDEFAAVVGGADDAADVAQRIRTALESPLAIDGVNVAVHASIGIARFPEDAHDARELARRADVAMYDAKRSRSGVASYVPERDDHSLEHFALAAALRDAFDRDELWLAYQPQVDIATGRICGAEALLRWRHPVRGDVPPGVLLPIAERTGLMPKLTQFVLRRAVAQAAAWRRAGLDLRMGVNVSAVVLVDENLPERVAAALKAESLTPDNLTIEVTEDAVMRDPRRCIAILERIAKLGVEISVDDFGTGHSSLEQLKRVPADELKLDRSFVMGMADDSHDAAIVRSVTELGRALGLRVVAEGVETPEVWRDLAALGCHVAQGFGIARPMPAAQFERWAREPSDRARLLVPRLHAGRALRRVA